MSNLLRSFITDQRPLVIGSFTKVILETTPLLAPAKAHAFSEKIFDYYTGLILSDLKPSDRIVQDVVAENQALGVTKEHGRIRVARYFELLDAQVEKAQGLDASEKERIKRMLNQSQNFMNTLTRLLIQRSGSGPTY